jgi:hypothetical protein
VTIQVADGTYSGPVTFKAYVGAGPVTIQGNTGTPSNVVLNSTSGHLLDVGVTDKYVLNGVKVQTSGGSYLPMYVRDGAHLELKNVVFGAAGFGAGLYLSTGASVDIRGPITIAASMPRWAWIEMCAQLNCFNQAFTITGSPTFSEFVNVTRLGVAVLTGNTYTGAATGMQYAVSSNAVLVKGGDVYPGTRPAPRPPGPRSPKPGAALPSRPAALEAAFSCPELIMAAGNFDACIPFIFREEGGFTKDPHDPGNWTGGKVGKGVLKGTNFGIAANSHPNLDIPNLTKAEAAKLYRVEYWSACSCDLLGIGVDLVVMDAAVNSGVGAAVASVMRRPRSPTR